MKPPAKILLPFLCAASLSAQDRPWQKISNPTAAELAANFVAPPSVYSSQVTWGWNGVMTREVIARDLDRLLSMNIHQAWIEPGRNPEAPYLSPAYFANVKIAVEEAKQRDMHLWFDDDGGYPSGFAGGKFTLERPDLDMKALAAAEQVPVAPGESFSRPLDGKTIGVVALNVDTGETQLIEPKAGRVEWTAPATGHWAVALSRWVFRSGVTKSANNKSGTKDAEHSLMDFLAPEADRLFITWTFEAYKQAVGDEFGKTLLGFRGDEASFGFNPWTPDFPAEFQKRKGYDIRPYLPAVAAIQIGRGGRGNAAPVAINLDAAHRAFADYCDVWSDLFGQNFFSAGAQWCAANNVEMQYHIEHEEILPQLAISNGDFFKCMRDIQVPGIDVIWHQLWHDVVADFPKLASSATHLNGHPQSMSESFAAMSGNYPAPNLEEAGWILNHQIALGITHFEFMSMGASTPRGAGGPGGPAGARRGGPPPADPTQPAAPLARGVATPGYRYINDPKFPAVAQYVNRTTFVLGQGRPAAQIGVYIPSSSFWFGDSSANRSFLATVHALLEHQRDVDFVDDYALAQSLRLQGGELVNLSGQGYRGIVIPPVDAISKAALDTLKAFAKAGGKVIFLGDAPRLVMDKNFLTATGPADISWAVAEPAGEVTPKVLAALPTPDVALDQAAAGLKYNHRHLKDAEVYFLFNEGETPLSLKATLATTGTAKQAQSWDANTGRIESVAGVAFANGKAILPVELEPWGTRLIVIGSTPPKVASN